MRFSRRDDEPFAFAGLWTAWRDREGGELVESCTIITTTPNELVAPVHDRMPVILQRQLERPWLDPEVETQEALSFLQPYAAALMKALPASPPVNNVRNDFPDLLAPSEPTRGRRGRRPSASPRAPSCRTRRSGAPRP
jgi:putative SOS response-associated peptidase YedK